LGRDYCRIIFKIFFSTGCYFADQQFFNQAKSGRKSLADDELAAICYSFGRGFNRLGDFKMAKKTITFPVYIFNFLFRQF
jgi:hypothetical protein